MKLLAFDTSGDRLSIGLYENGKPKGSFSSASFRRHSETLIPAVQKLLKKRKWKIESLDCVAVGLGPGSFSGLRVGVATAKMFSFASKARLVGVSSLAAAAHGAKKMGPIAVTLDAKKGLVYGALYERKKDQFVEKIKPALFEYDAFIKKCPKNAHFIKDFPGAAASSIAGLAANRIKNNDFDDLFRIEPEYLHAKDCNVTKKK